MGNTKLLLASVPQLHKKWGELDEMLTTTRAQEPMGERCGALVEVEDGHFVSRVGENGDAGP